MFRTIPIIIENANSEEPPLLIKGKGIPITGLNPIVIPIFTKKWTKKIPATQ